MKIVLNDVSDVEDFLKMLSPSYFRLIQKASTGMDALTDNMSGPCSPGVENKPITVEASGEADDIAAPEVMSDTEVEARISEHAAPVGTATVDLDGVAHHTDWHSTPAKINADGRWKARRGRDNDEYKGWVALWSTNGAEPAVAADAEPIATETHALPQDEDSRDAGAAYAGEGGKPQEAAAPTVDLAALVEASQEAALDASDSHMDLIKACQAFISDHGHPAYNALKAAVAPLEGAENGKAVPQFTPAERRLMRACIENYPRN